MQMKHMLNANALTLANDIIRIVLIQAIALTKFHFDYLETAKYWIHESCESFTLQLL